MVSRLDDESKAKHISETLQSFLRKEMQLPLPSFQGPREKCGVEVFGALLGLHRASNPLFPQRTSLRSMKVVCPLTRRFPTTLTGRLVHYEDVQVALAEVIDKDGPSMDLRKMWRLLLWIWLGNGGHKHKAWHLLKDTPAATAYRPGPRQPFEVLRWTIHAVCTVGSLMKVIGSDGLDKKSRLSSNRILYLKSWHEAVPSLVEAFKAGSEAFSTEIGKIIGLRGDLTSKELVVLLSASKYSSIRDVAHPLPFGQGARNGAKAFLNIEQMKGSDSSARYCDLLEQIIPELERTITKYFPNLPPQLRKVTLGDIEPCLCGAFVYTRLATQLRKVLPKMNCKMRGLDDETWSAVETLGTPAGFLPHDRNGKLEVADDVELPSLPYSKWRLAAIPPSRLINKRGFFRLWGFGDIKKKALSPPEKRGSKRPWEAKLKPGGVATAQKKQRTMGPESGPHRPAEVMSQRGRAVPEMTLASRAGPIRYLNCRIYIFPPRWRVLCHVPAGSNSKKQRRVNQRSFSWGKDPERIWKQVLSFCKQHWKLRQ